MVDAEYGPGTISEDLLKGLVIASNRGPVAFHRRPDGTVVPRRGAGGLVTALSHVMAGAGGCWLASAITGVDREMARTGRRVDVASEGAPGGTISVRYLAFDPKTYDLYYNRVSNWMIWFLQHGMWHLPLEPNFDQETVEAWQAYRAVNQAFAETLAEETGAVAGQVPVVLHDYHLMVAAPHLRRLVPEAFVYHFSHIPWAQPDAMRVLPAGIAVETLEGMLAANLLGFQTTRWARNFLWCCHELLGADVDFGDGIVHYRHGLTRVRYYPISVDVGPLRRLAASDEARGHADWLRGLLDGRKLVLRIDRLELSKNVVRGLKAFELLLTDHPHWRERVVHVALLYPSRRGIPEYAAYEAEVTRQAERINAELGTPGWQPVMVFNKDDYPRAVAALTLYDVLLVNPIADGMNLVSKEGPAVNTTDGALVLSRNAGSWYELGAAALSINPYDVAETAAALDRALAMEPAERSERAALLRQIVEANSSWKWLGRQLEDIAPHLERAR
jgi:trehalose 6-phosphate synthase